MSDEPRSHFCDAFSLLWFVGASGPLRGQWRHNHQMGSDGVDSFTHTPEMHFKGSRG